MNVKKTIATGLAVASILAVTALPAFADNTKETTYINSPWTCPTGAQPNNNAAGFVNVNLQNGNINGEFSVKGGQVNETYQVYITTQNCGVVEVVGTLTTNGQGNGNVHFNVPQIAGATSYDVYAWNHNFTQYIAAHAVAN